MPYIKQKDKQEIKDGRFPYNPGELNYVITKLILKYIDMMNVSEGKEAYETYNSVLGVLDSVGRELYRRKIAPYEDRKLRENGDVY